jgi:hypothetical protein
MFRIREIGDNLTQGQSPIREPGLQQPMLTISIIFAVLVALWGFSGTLASYAKSSFVAAKARPRPATGPRPVAQPRPAGASRSRGTRPVASA